MRFAGLGWLGSAREAMLAALSMKELRHSNPSHHSSHKHKAAPAVKTAGIGWGKAPAQGVIIVASCMTKEKRAKDLPQACAACGKTRAPVGLVTDASSRMEKEVAVTPGVKARARKGRLCKAEVQTTGLKMWTSRGK